MTAMEKATYDPADKNTNAFNSANHDYLAPGATAPAETQTVSERLAKEVWVTDYGAEPGGLDCRPAIAKAILAGGLVRFPPGTFYVSKDPTSGFGIELLSNTFLVGAGQGATVIKALNGAGTMNLVATTIDPLKATVSNIGIRDLTLDHNGQNLGAASGCHAVRLCQVEGFYMRGVTVKNSDQHGVVTATKHDPTIPVNKNIFISDVYLENIGVSGRAGGDGLRLFNGAESVVVNNVIGRGIEYHGIHIAYGAATVSNVILYNVGAVAVSPQSDGVLMSNIHIEWQDGYLISDLYANRPAAGLFGRSFYVTDPTLPVGVSRWYYDNGVVWQKASSNPTGLWAITRSGDSGEENFPTGGKSQFSNIKIVMNITENQPFDWKGSYGFQLETDYNSADNIYVYGKFRYGAYIAGSYNNVSNITIEGCREDGVRIAGNAENEELGNYNILDGWRVKTANLDPLPDSSPTNRAVRISNGIHNKVINGFALDAVHVSIAISEEGSANYSIITGNDVVSSSAAKIATVGADTIVRGNLGCKTEARGSATILNGNNSVTVSHGLNRSPGLGSIMVTPTNNPTNNPGRFWVSSIGSSTFIIICENTPGASGATFAWNAEIL